MNITNTVFRKILEDSNLSRKISAVLGIKQISVEQLARRKSNKLCHYGCVMIYKDFGMSDKQIFGKENLKEVIDAL